MYNVSDCKKIARNAEKINDETQQFRRISPFWSFSTERHYYKVSII